MPETRALFANAGKLLLKSFLSQTLKIHSNVMLFAKQKPGLKLVIQHC